MNALVIDLASYLEQYLASGHLWNYRFTKYLRQLSFVSNSVEAKQ